MKKSFRGAAGQGSKNKGKGQGKGDHKGKEAKRPIKNARSLRDVLGLPSPDEDSKSKGDCGPRHHARPGQRPERRSERPERSEQRGDQRSDQKSTQKPGRPEVASGAGKKPASNKLQYIMSFTPPGQAPQAKSEQPAGRPERGSARPERPVGRPERPSGKPERQSARPERQPARSERQSVRPERSVDRPERTSGKPERPPVKPDRPTAKPEKQTRGLNVPQGEIHRREDFQWPKDRVREEQENAQPVRTGRGGQKRIQGVIKRHPDGFGFLIPDNPEHPDVYIARQYMGGVMTNDRVEAEVYPAKGRDHDRFFGEITRVLSRSSKRIVGKYLPVDLKYGVILDEGHGWGADLRIATQDSMGAKEGDLVAIEVTQYPGPDQEFTGRVIEILGDIEEPLGDVRRVIYSHGIPNEFSAQTLGEARRFGSVVTEPEMKEREDLRDIDLITIDGATARDFDDAIYTEQTQRGFRLVVAIADVSHYVKPATHLDESAYERGTSTYFPNFVVPMLPEELSNELCSLKPHVPRLCFACEMMINFNGDVEAYRFFEGVMESKARVIYGEAQEVVDGKCPPKLRHVEQNILRSADLAKILMQKRFREGSLDLEIPETQVVVDSLGETVDIIKSERLFAHRLIEELMLVTNICTARFFDREDLIGIYRIHDEPKEDNIQALQRFLWNFGGSKALAGPNGKGGLQKKLTKALQAMEGKPGAQVLNILTLRSMNQAQYSHQNIGHFGLGFSHYAHFTSPIRRYPDLIAHRLIKSRLYPRYRSMEMTEEELASASVHLSACEQRSAKAERQLISIKKARFIRRFIGEEFEGMISSVTKFGVFVLLRQYDVDGLVKLEALGDDRFIFDEENLKLVGKKTGVEFTIGDVIKVRVVGADPEQGRVEFEMADAEGGSGGKAQGRKKERVDVQKRGKTQNDRRGVREKRVSKRRGKN